MEMEHINENLIKVLIGPEDLEERGIDFLDLIGDQSSIEKFFYQILEEVDINKQFQGSEAVTFQVMPNKDGLELYISRADLDGMDDAWADELTKYLMDHKREELSEILSDEDDDVSVEQEDAPQMSSCRQYKYMRNPVIKFDELDDFIALARDISDPAIEADLYSVEDAYFIHIKHIDYSDKDIIDGLYHSFLEYGEAMRITPDVLQEYGTLLRKGDTLSYFGKNF